VLLTPALSGPLAPSALGIASALQGMEEDEERMFRNMGPTFSQRAMSVMLPVSASVPLGLGQLREHSVPRPTRAMSMAEFFDMKPVRPSIALHPTPSRAPPPYSAPSVPLLAGPSPLPTAPSLSALAASASVLARDPVTGALLVERMEHEALAEETEENVDADEEGPEAGSPTRLTRDALAYYTLQQFSLSEKLTRWANCTDFGARPQPSLETAAYSVALSASVLDDPRRRFGSLVRRTVV
jgi:hypothetical protein